MRDKKNWTKWLYWFTLAVAIILVYKTVGGLQDISTLFSRLVWVLTPFLMAILVAYLLYIPCRFIERLYKRAKMSLRLARTLSVLTVYLIAILLIVLLLNIVWPAVSNSIVELANNLPGYYNQAIYFVDNLEEDSPIRGAVYNIVESLEEIDIATFVNQESIANYISGAMRSSKLCV